MSRAIRYALRFFVVVAIIGLVAAQAGTLSPRMSPYLSSLSMVVVSNASAAPACKNKYCDFQVPASCYPLKGYFCGLKGIRCHYGACV